MYRLMMVLSRVPLLLTLRGSSRNSLRPLLTWMDNPAGLKEMYSDIASAQPLQQTNYMEWLAETSVDIQGLQRSAANCGLCLNAESGQVSYTDPMQPSSMKLCFDLIYVRHGQTNGNQEPRVFQGYVDEAINKLNEKGIEQANHAANQLDMNPQFSPDLIVLSPLSRAIDTAESFLRRHPELKDKTEVWDSSHEMAFGAWDNVKVKDLPVDHRAHLFYLAQNAVVKSDLLNPAYPHMANENFVEVLSRFFKVLQDIDCRLEPLARSRKNMKEAAPIVLMYGHSMAGAAIGILTGNGKVVDGGSHLGFDGKYILPNATPVTLHRA